MDKKTERREALRARNEIPKNEWAEKNDVLNRCVAEYLASASFETLGFFLPIGSEPRITETVTAWLSEKTGRKAYLPITEGKNMRFAKWTPETPLRIGKFNVSEPVSSEFSRPELLLVPCVGLNPSGYRLGYGAGFYDRYLAEVNNTPYTVGICFKQFCGLNFEPDPFDIALDASVSEAGFIIY